MSFAEVERLLVKWFKTGALAIAALASFAAMIVGGIMLCAALGNVLHWALTLGQCQS
jgi:TctA family transporter